MKPPFNCIFCGAASWLDTSDQMMPAAYCHPEDHGNEQDYRDYYGDDGEVDQTSI